MKIDKPYLGHQSGDKSNSRRVCEAALFGIPSNLAHILLSPSNLRPLCIVKLRCTSTSYEAVEPELSEITRARTNWIVSSCDRSERYHLLYSIHTKNNTMTAKIFDFKMTNESQRQLMRMSIAGCLRLVCIH